MRVHVVVNHSSGRSRATDEGVLRDIDLGLRRRGVVATVELVEPAGVAASVRRALARSVDAVLVAGGDGSVSAAASMLVGASRPLGVVPTGTRNNFARDLGVPLDLDGALAVIAAGDVRTVDLAEVNGHTFVNNSSLGVYPDVVALREHERTRGAGRLSAFARALWRATRDPTTLEVEVSSNGNRVVRRTSFLVVANNAYQLALPAPWSRSRLDAGELVLYMAGKLHRRELIALAFDALLDRAGPDRLEAVRAMRLSVDAGRHRLRVALDGEVLHLTPPLLYRTLPGALRVLALPPARSQDVEPPRTELGERVEPA
jgi:diacylglycerol kinase family enzyme